MKNLKSGGKPVLYRCRRCGFYYSEKKWQKACEEWCSKHASCSLAITRHAVK